MKKVMGCVVLTKYMKSAKQDEEGDGPGGCHVQAVHDYCFT